MENLIHDQALSLIYKNASIGILISDSDGTIVSANSFAHFLFGYEEKELIGLKIESLVPQNIDRKHIELRNQYFKNPSSRPMGMGRSLKARKKDNSLFSVEISLSSYEFSSKRFAVAFVSDVTISVELAEALKEQARKLESYVEQRTTELTQALEDLNNANTQLLKQMKEREIVEKQVRDALTKEQELNELKSRFVSIASHEFRTPLSGIMNSASLISKYPNEDQQEKREKHLRTIKKSVRNLTVILNDFLSLDKLENNKLKAMPYKFSLREFIEEINEEFKDLVKNNQVIQVVYSQCDIIFQDKEILRNILINLMSNAIKYSPEGSLIKILCQESSETISISIIDEGFGIPLEDQRHLFERFFRASNVNAIQGTGLGLNIVKRYVELLEGSISFESEVGKGTSFILKLPKDLKI